MRLGIFGGSFDPVHLGHLLLAECCREQCELDTVWFLPAGVPPHKQDRQLSPAATRIEMLELAIAGNPQFEVKRWEADRGGVSYTVDTLERLAEENPAAEPFLLLGADMLNDLPGWHRAERVCELALPVAVGRAGVAGPNFAGLRPVATPERIGQILKHRVAMPRIELSAAEIRRRVAAGQSIRYRVPRAVEVYIETHGLYRL